MVWTIWIELEISSRITKEKEFAGEGFRALILGGALILGAIEVALKSSVEVGVFEVGVLVEGLLELAYSANEGERGCFFLFIYWRLKTDRQHSRLWLGKMCKSQERRRSQRTGDLIFYKNISFSA